MCSGTARNRLRKITLSALVLGIVLIAACDPPPKSSDPKATSSTDEPVSGNESEAQNMYELPPGAVAQSAALRQRLAVAAEGHDAKVAARALHKDSAGKPLYINRLALESSPYLLQHAHNPIDWFSWGDEAFARAKELDRPIFLSIGYSTCHWCHVMEEESFEDLEVARLLNERYVAIKVDREQRPDIDDVYMTAVQAMTGSGGWPMSIVLSPDKKPFFAATYLPPRGGVRGSRNGLIEILTQLEEAYHVDKRATLESADRIANHLALVTAPAEPDSMPGVELLHSAALRYIRMYDPVYGGVGSAPKFPQPSILRLLLRANAREANPDALQVVSETLRHMADGGIYDHVGGGFHRYSTDREWLVPHFEKMLYDNAQLVVAYLEAYQVSGDPALADVARDVLRYVEREMLAEEGVFFSATDADSEGEEGTFFLWDESQLDDLLEPAEALAVKTRFGVTAAGNFEGRNILHVVAPLDAVQSALSDAGQSGDAATLLQSARTKLYDARALRIWPGLDDKVLTSWNGLMLSAFARAAFVLNEPHHLDVATRAADQLLIVMTVDGKLQRSYWHDTAQIDAFLDDYAFLIAGLLDVYEASSQPKVLSQALALQETLDQQFWDDDHGAYFSTSNNHEVLLTRSKPSYDGAEPSGNAVAAMNLIRLAEFTSDFAYKEKAQALFATFDADLRARPTSSPALLCALDFAHADALEVVVVRAAGDDAKALIDVLRENFIPNAVFVLTDEADVAAHAKVAPLVDEKRALNGQSTVYVCQSGRCDAPTHDVATLRTQLQGHGLRLRD